MMITDVLGGFRYFMRGLKLIWHPRLKPFVMWPIGINVTLFSIGLYFGVGWFHSKLSAWLSELPSWLQWLEWAFWLLFIVLALLIVFYTFSLLANLIAGPFNSWLAQAVESLEVGEQYTSPFSWPVFFKEFVANFGSMFKKLVYIGTRTIPLFIISIIPAVNMIAPWAWLLFGAWLLALEYADYPMGNHGMSFSKIRATLGGKQILTVSFGLAVLLATMIPLLNFFVMPAAVAGATLLWLERFRDPLADTTPVPAASDEASQTELPGTAATAENRSPS